MVVDPERLKEICENFSFDDLNDIYYFAMANKKDDAKSVFLNKSKLTT